jgi:MAF protein
VLASASPRRHELLSLLGLPFSVWSGEVDETPRPDEPPDMLVARLSATKAAAARNHLVESGATDPDTLLVAADTVVVLGDRILGKPASAAKATAMLEQLRARAHRVHSAVTVVQAGSGRAAIHLNTTVVWMRDYSDEEIAAYVSTGDPLDKAGAYAIQHPGFHPVVRIEGCFTGVMGLPLGALEKALARFDVAPSVPGGLAAACRNWTGHACCLE